MARPLEFRPLSPIPDRLPLKRLGLALDELLPGLGDQLTASESCRFPDSFPHAEHLAAPLSHGEELWSRELQDQIEQRLRTFE